MRILIGHDGSESSDAAVDDLARAGLPVVADVLVLSVADLMPVSDVPVSTATAYRVEQMARTTLLEDAALFAGAARDQMRRVMPAWRIEAESCAGSPAQSLLDRAASWKADLLVVGSHGRSALGRAVFGSVAQQVLNGAPCTLHVARGGPLTERPGGVRLVVGVDASPGSDATVREVLSRTWPRGSAAKVVTVVNPLVLTAFAKPASSHDDVHAWIRTVNEVATEKLAAAGLDAAPVIVDGDPKRELVKQASAWGADAIFVGAHGLHGGARAFAGSVASAVAARASCSVEVVRGR